MKIFYLLSLFFLPALASFAQEHRIYGTISNTTLEPIAYVSVSVKCSTRGAISAEDGSYELKLYDGLYELVVTMVGYEPQVVKVVVNKTDTRKDFILELDKNGELSEVTVHGKWKDPSAGYIENVIRHKKEIMDAPGAYSCELYIRAQQEDSSWGKKQDKQDSIPESDSLRREMNRMSLAEVVLQYDYASPRHQKEERKAVSIRGNAGSLFYLSATEGDFNFYQNLLRLRNLSETPFLSPFSFSGLMAYKFKLIATDSVGARKIYTIAVQPRQLSNSTVSGTVQVVAGEWVIWSTKLQFPEYHLPEYDFFEVEQQYRPVDSLAWMIVSQHFRYSSSRKRKEREGETFVNFRNFELQKEFPPKYFGVELSKTSQEAYERDSVYWQQSRAEPLSEKELDFIRYKDSVYELTHTEHYLDSLDDVNNRITWKNVLLNGISFNDHKKERRWSIPPVPAIYQPFYFGGSRINASVFYTKRYPDRKFINWSSYLSYGLRNKDLNGSIRFTKLYNPFNRGMYTVRLRRDFEYIFRGDAWINMIKRNNFYLDNSLGFGHELEIKNGLFLYTDVDMAFRRSVAGYKTNPQVDSLLGDVLEDNQAVYFEPYNAFYGKLNLSYTPFQKYIREPKEKIILGSSWPTFYVEWRKGIPGLFRSKVDFDYLEFGLHQEVKMGLLGTGNYRILTGSFLSRRDLRLVDYKFQRRGDPFLFMNPNEAFQSLDSTFPVFKRFYQGHYVHEFNGAILNRIPLLKKLGLREVAGGGFLFAQERNLRYGEMFAGIERVFNWPFDLFGKCKIGVYVVGSAANQFSNPVQFKIGITTWDKIRNRWF